VRALAEKADPFTRIRLLQLADRYERKPAPPKPAVAPERAGLTDAVGLVEEVLSIRAGGLGVTVKGAEAPIAPTLTSRLLLDIVQGRQ
jgi:hypothetical protein